MQVRDKAEATMEMQQTRSNGDVIRRLTSACTLTTFLVSTFLATTLTGCNDYPVHSLLDSFGARVTSSLANSKPVKLDFLWVIDHSPSMCKQQRDLSKAFTGFTDDLKALGQVDAQMAVVTVQQIADPPSATGVTVKTVGKFNNTPATNFPPNCIEHFRAPCYVSPSTDPTAANDSSSTASEDCRNQFEYSFNPPSPPSSLCPGPPYGAGTKSYVNPLGGAHDTAQNNEWRCKNPQALSFVTNDNCSVNSYCWRHCTTNAECVNIFGEGATCYSPGNDASYKEAGCLFPPPTSDCPDPSKATQPCESDDDCQEANTRCVGAAGAKLCTPYLPTVLKNDQLNLFHCIATVGASSSQQSGFEGGLRSAWMAIDPAGPNCPGGPVIYDDDGNPQPNPNCQYAQLVRDDAYLVIVIVSDDDDCSVDLSLSLANSTDAEKTALKALLPTEDWNRCQWLGDAVGGNRALNEGNCLYVKSKKLTDAEKDAYKCPSDCAPTDTACLAAAEVNVLANRSVDKRFAPVSDFVNRFKSLKTDPAHVIVAAISGDSSANDVQQKSKDLAMYFKSLRRNQAAGQSPYVCAGLRGESGYGSRYVELVNAFGANGIFANICEGANFTDALKGISSTILKRIVHVCLPYPPEEVAGVPQLQVNQIRDGEKTTLAYTSDPTDSAAGSYFIQATPDCRAGATTITGESQACTTIRDCAPGLACIDKLCRVYSSAVYFTEVPSKGDEIEINYAADLGFTTTVK